jgi:hypothetical protein
LVAEGEAVKVEEAGEVGHGRKVVVVEVEKLEGREVLEVQCGELVRS